MKWVWRTCSCGQCQVRQGIRQDAWMTIVLRTQRCAILELEPRVLCNSVRALFVGVLFTHTPSVGWRFYSRQPKPVLTLRQQFTSRQGLKNAENFNCSSFNGFGPTLTTMTKLFAGWPAILTQMSASFTATLYITSKLFQGQPRGHILRCPQIIVLFAVLFVDCEEWFCILLGSLPGARHAIVCILFSLE